MTGLIMGLGKPLEQDSYGPKDSVLQKQALYLKGGAKSSMNSFRSHVTQNGQGPQEEILLSKVAAVAVEWEAQGMP